MKELDQEEKVRSIRLDIAMGRFDILWGEYSRKNIEKGLDNLEILKNKVVETLNLQIMNPQAAVVIEGDPYFIKRVQSLADWAQHPDRIPKSILTKDKRRKIVSYTGQKFNDHYAGLMSETLSTAFDFTGRARKFAGRPAEEG